MEVEVKQPEGYYLKAFVNDITDAGLDVVYERGWRKPELVNFARCRAMVAEVVQKSNFKAGDIVDAYLKIGKDDDINAWYKMKIREIKGEYVILDGVEDANRNDVILLNQCRHPALTTQITSTTVKSCTIPVNDDLLDYFARGDESLKLLQESIPNILMKLDRTAKELVIKSFSMGAIKKVGMLRDAFLTNSRQKMALLQRQEEQKKMLSVEEPIHNAALCIDFEVSTDFMGLAIGSQGANIQNARALEGIKEVILDESMRDHGFCKFKVYAENAEAAEQARNMLEFLQQHKMVPQGKVGQVIGKQGKTIQDIVDKSGVVRVQIGDENPEQGMVPFTFTGTREAISNAELMVEFQLKHIIEMDEIRAEEDEIRRKLYMSRNSPFLHYNNNGGGHHVPFNRPQHQQNNMRRINGGGPGGGNRPPQQDGEDQQQQQPHQQQQRRMGGSGGPGGGFRSSGGPRGPPRFNQNQQQGGGVDGPRGDRGGPVGNRFRGGPGGGGNQQQRRDGGGQPRRQFQGQNHFFQQKPRNQQQQQRDHNQQHENNDQQPPQQQQYDASPPRAKRMVESDEEVSSNEGTNSGAAISKNE